MPKQAINFYRRGEIRDRSTEGEHYRIAGLNLLTAIIIFWNTLKLGDAVENRTHNGLPIPHELLAHVSPLGWEHINLIGAYRWPSVIPSQSEKWVSSIGAAYQPTRRMTMTQMKFIGFDVHKETIAVAIADESRTGEVRFYGAIPNTPEAIRRLVDRLCTGGELHFCYEADGGRYGIYRQLLQLGTSCMVIAPSMMPKKPGDRIKNDRRDAVTLARLLRAGELTAICVPDEDHEAVRDLVRAASGERRSCCCTADVAGVSVAARAPLSGSHELDADALALAW